MEGGHAAEVRPLQGSGGVGGSVGAHSREKTVGEAGEAEDERNK